LWLFLIVLANLGEAETFAENHLLGKETFPPSKKRLLERVFIAFIALERKCYFSLTVEALGILQIC
jgi:hypothetical protein